MSLLWAVDRVFPAPDPDATVSPESTSFEGTVIDLHRTPLRTVKEVVETNERDGTVSHRSRSCEMVCASHLRPDFER